MIQTILRSFHLVLCIALLTGCGALSTTSYNPYVLPQSYEKTWYPVSGHSCYRYTFHSDSTITYFCDQDSGLYGITEYKVIGKVNNLDYFVVSKDTYTVTYDDGRIEKSITYDYERYSMTEDDRNPGHYSMYVYRGYGPEVSQNDWNTITPEQHFIRMTTYGNETPSDDGCRQSYPDYNYSSRASLFTSDDLQRR